MKPAKRVVWRGWPGDVLDRDAWGHGSDPYAKAEREAIQWLAREEAAEVAAEQPTQLKLAM